MSEKMSELKFKLEDSEKERLEVMRQRDDNRVKFQLQDQENQVLNSKLKATRHQLHFV